jgi:tRNA-modifying protein YgfZ
VPIGWDQVTTWLSRQYPSAAVGAGEENLPRIAHAGAPWEEYQALTRTAGLVVTPDLAPILVEGRDAVDYLHRRLAQAIKPLPVGRGAHALQLGGDGRLQADWLVYRGEESVMLLAPAERADADASLVEKYTLNDEVTVDRFYSNEVMIALAGPSAPAMIAALIEPRRPEAEIRDTPYLGYFTVMLTGVPCRIFRDSRWPMPFFYLCAPPMAIEQLLRALNEVFRAAGGRACGAEALRFARLEAGVPRWGESIGEGLIPLEAHLLDAISFDKGCYPGQEIMARINNLGHPARSLTRCRLDTEICIPEGTALFDKEEPVGEIAASATLAGSGRMVGLAYLKWPHRSLTTAVVNHEDKRLRLELNPLRNSEHE